MSRLCLLLPAALPLPLLVACVSAPESGSPRRHCDAGELDVVPPDDDDSSRRECIAVGDRGAMWPDRVNACADCSGGDELSRPLLPLRPSLRFAEWSY